MAGWQTIKLSDVVRTNVSTYSLSDNWEFVNYLDTGNIVTNEIALIQRIELAQGEKLPSRARRKVEIGDIIYSTVRPNQLHYGFIDNIPENFLVSTGFAVLHPEKGKIDAKFLYYLLVQNDITEKLQAIAEQSTSTYPSIKPSDIEDLDFIVPEIKVQRKISNILSAIDKKIELNAQINHNLEEQLYALYASNYDNLSGKKVPLKECCSFQEGYVNPTQTKPEYFDGSVKWLRAVDINESFIISTSRTLTEQGFASAGKSALLFPKDSIAISKSGTIGRLGIVADNMCGNRAVINIVPKQKKWLAFIYCYLKSRQAEFSDLAVGSVQKNLYVSILEPLEIFSPADSVLNDFHFSAQTILEKMKNNCFEMQSLAQLRDALLPKLMSGEIDVSEVEV